MTTPNRWRAAAILALAASPALADERDDRIERLERESAEMRREIAELKAQRAPDADAVRAAVDDYLAQADRSSLGTWVPAVQRRTGLTIGGYFSTRYLAREQAGKEPSFVDMRLVPKLHADITQAIAFDAEVEIEHGGVSDETDGEIVVEQAELSFRSSDAFTLKVGTLLVPFGAFNQNHDDPMNELSSRPTVDRYVVPSAFACPGIGARGSIEVSDDAVFTYDVVLVNGLSDSIDAEEGTRGARTLFEEDDNHDKTVFGRVGVVPTVPFLDALDLGASGAFGAVGEDSDRLTGFGCDASAKRGPWEFKGEFDQFGIDTPRGSSPPIDAAGDLGPIRGLHGWYGQILYRITDPWVRSLPWAEKDSSVALVLRRDSVDLDDRVHGASAQDDERAWSVGVNYRPTSKTVIKFEYRHARSGAQGSLGDDRDFFAVEFATYF
jgi:hypothetical protein